MSHPLTNLFEQLPESAAEEVIQLLLDAGPIRIERIVSTGQCSPDGFWYDQTEAEWVLLLQGEASLRFENRPAPVQLRRGDFVHIPAHEKHRVESTSPSEPTIWLAIFYDPQAESTASE